MRKSTQSKSPRNKSGWYSQLRGSSPSPPILFLHGFTGISDDWLAISQQLEGDYFSILPDLPGHGRSANPTTDESITIQSVAAGIIKLMDEIGIQQAVLVGYSMGGRVALYTALHYPDRFNALVLESSGPGIEDEYERHVRMALDDDRAYHLRVQGLQVFLEQWYKSTLFESINRYPERLAKLKQSHQIHGVEGLASALQGLSTGRQPSLWNKLEELRIPTLLICGSLDHTFTKITRIMSEQIPSCEWKIIGDAGHNTHFEHPEAFVTTLRRFLDERVLKSAKLSRKVSS